MMYDVGGKTFGDEDDRTFVSVVLISDIFLDNPELWSFEVSELFNEGSTMPRDLRAC